MVTPTKKEKIPNNALQSEKNIVYACRTDGNFTALKNKKKT